MKNGPILALILAAVFYFLAEYGFHPQGFAPGRIISLSLVALNLHAAVWTFIKGIK